MPHSTESFDWHLLAPNVRVQRLEKEKQIWLLTKKIFKPGHQSIHQRDKHKLVSPPLVRRRTTAPFNGPFVHLNGATILDKSLGTNSTTCYLYRFALKKSLFPIPTPLQKVMTVCPECNSQINIDLAYGGGRTLNETVQVRFHEEK